MFTADVFSDIANGVNLVLGPATGSSTDLIANHSFTDNNLVAHNNEFTSNMTGALMQGRIKKAHPIWGTIMITIPFLPMLMIGIVQVVSLSSNPWLMMYSCIKNQERQLKEIHKISKLGHLLLLIPFSIVATPFYICYTIFTGLREIIWPNGDDDSALDTDKAADLRSNEVLMESSLQTCLGM